MTEACQGAFTDSSDAAATTEEALLDQVQELQERQAEVSALLKGSRAVLEYRDFQDAARSIFDSCKNLLGATSGYVALLAADGSENEVLFLDSGGLPCNVDSALPMPIRGLRERAYRSGKAVFHNDFSRSEWVQLLPKGHVCLANVLFAPLVIDGKTLGLLGLANKSSDFTNNDARMASAFGELAAIALQNSRTLESLEHSEERFRSLTQSASDGIISTDSHGSIVYWNKAAENIFGYLAADMIGKPLDAIIPENSRGSHREGFTRVASTGHSKIIGKTVEVTGLRRNGKECPIELSLATTRTGEGLFFTAILRDITKRERTEQERQKLTHDLGERVKELNCLYGLSRLVETPNITLDQIFQGVVELIPPGWQFPESTCARLIFEDKEFTTDGFRATSWRQSAQIKVGGRRSGSVEVYYQCEMPECDEGPFLIEERHLLDAITERLGRIVDRKQAEDALQKAKDLLEIEVQQRTSELRIKEESLAEAQRIAHLGNWDWNIPTSELFWSDEVYRIFGLSPQEVAATYDTFLECVHPDDRRQIEETVNRALKKPGADYSIDHRVIRPDGSERIVHERGEVMFDHEGKPERMIGTVHDITEQKKLEREILNISTDEQRRIGQELHDGLGQELTGLNYLAKSLHRKLQAKGLAEAGAAAELAEGIPQVVGQLQTIVKGLVPLEVDGGNLVHALYGLAVNVEERTGVSCRFESRGRVQVNDDNTAIQLYRIAQEAVNNAVKHGQSQQITLALTSDHDQIRLEVCDDGIGVEPNVDKASGSGLRIMRHRAGVIGGRFEIRQRTSGGTLVACIFPREKHNDQQ